MSVPPTKIGTSPHLHIALATVGGTIGTIVVGLLNQWSPWIKMDASTKNAASLLIIAACTYGAGWLSAKLSLSSRKPAGPVDPPQSSPPFLGGSVTLYSAPVPPPSGGSFSMDGGRSWHPITISSGSIGQPPHWPGPPDTEAETTSGEAPPSA